MDELKRFLREAGFNAAVLAALAVVVVLLWSIAGCDDAPSELQPSSFPLHPLLEPCGPEQNPFRDAPPADVPPRFRVSNYAGGSCNHSAMIQVLKWQGLNDVAAWWRKTYSGGESAEGLARKAGAKGLRFAATFSGDASFLEWCSRTRRGAAIHYFPNHAITFLGYDGQDNAVLLDNNCTGVYIRIPKATFIARWRGYGGRAITVVYTPPPPRPWVPRAHHGGTEDGEEEERVNDLIFSPCPPCLRGESPAAAVGAESAPRRHGGRGGGRESERLDLFSVPPW